MRRLAVIGDPISHSLSPAMQSAAIEAAGLEQKFSYEAVKVAPQDLPAFLRKIRDGEFFGANVTIPHKEAVIPLLDGISERSKASSSVNTIVFTEGRLYGDTTDGRGCLEALKENGIKIQNKSIAILGAGGSAQAVALALAKECPSRIRVLNRSLTRASALVKKISHICQADSAPLPSPLNDFDIIINCTPLGMKGEFQDFSPLREDDLPAKGTVMDLVYRPLSTPLLRLAEQRGLRAIDGTRMLIHQGALSFSIWTGMEADIHAMEDALRKAME